MFPALESLPVFVLPLRFIYFFLLSFLFCCCKSVTGFCVPSFFSPAHRVDMLIIQRAALSSMLLSLSLSLSLSGAAESARLRIENRWNGDCARSRRRRRSHRFGFVFSLSIFSLIRFDFIAFFDVPGLCSRTGR